MKQPSAFVVAPPQSKILQTVVLTDLHLFRCQPSSRTTSLRLVAVGALGYGVSSIFAFFFFSRGRGW
jgi:hypothetical protein